MALMASKTALKQNSLNPVRAIAKTLFAGAHNIAILWCLVVTSVVVLLSWGAFANANIIPHTITALFLGWCVVRKTTNTIPDQEQEQVENVDTPSGNATMSQRFAQMEQENAQLLKQLNAVTYHRDSLAREINIDPLTGAQNRRGLDLGFDAHGAGTVFAMLDLDHFKNINDTLGHDVGDRVLQNFASVLQNRLGNETPVYRIGGEEFIILFPKGQVADVVELLDDIRDELQNTNFTRMSDSLKVSFSAGLAMREEFTQSFDEIYKQADDNLYVAKTTGRGKTVSTSFTCKPALLAA